MGLWCFSCIRCRLGLGLLPSFMLESALCGHYALPQGKRVTAEDLRDIDEVFSTSFSCVSAADLPLLPVVFVSLCAEFNKICLRTALGFIVMGFIGFFVKLIFIVSPAAPLSNVI